MSKIKNIYKEVAKELNLSTEIVEKVYKQYWRLQIKHLEDIDLQNDYTDEQLDNLQLNFNIPEFGKIFLDRRYYKNFKKYGKNIKRKSNKTS